MQSLLYCVAGSKLSQSVCEEFTRSLVNFLSQNRNIINFIMAFFHYHPSFVINFLLLKIESFCACHDTIILQWAYFLVQAKERKRLQTTSDRQKRTQLSKASSTILVCRGMYFHTYFLPIVFFFLLDGSEQSKHILAYLTWRLASWQHRIHIY